MLLKYLGSCPSIFCYVTNTQDFIMKSKAVNGFWIS